MLASQTNGPQVIATIDRLMEHADLKPICEDSIELSTLSRTLVLKDDRTMTALSRSGPQISYIDNAVEGNTVNWHGGITYRRLSIPYTDPT